MEAAWFLLSAVLKTLSVLSLFLQAPVFLLFFVIRESLAQFLSWKFGRNVFSARGPARGFVCPKFQEHLETKCHSCQIAVIVTKDPQPEIVFQSLAQSFNVSPWPLKFRCYLKMHWNFLFWVEDPHFRLEDHVVSFKGTLEEVLKTTHKHEAGSSSLWKFDVCSDGIRLQVHHALLDGIGGMRFIASTLLDLSGEPLEIWPMPKKDPSLWIRLNSFLFQYYATARSLYPLLNNKLDWGIDTSNENTTTVYARTTFTSERLKRIGKSFNRASIPQILTAAITMAQSQLRNCDKNSTFCHTLIVTAHKRKPFKVMAIDEYSVNKVSFICFQVPALGIADTLESVQRSYNKLRNDPCHLGPVYVTYFYNLLPRSSAVFAVFNTIGQMSQNFDSINSVPGFNRRCRIRGGNPVESVWVSQYLPCHNLMSFQFHFTNYAGDITLCVSLNPKVLEPSGFTAEGFLRLVSEAVDELEKISQRDVSLEV